MADSLVKHVSDILGYRRNIHEVRGVDLPRFRNDVKRAVRFSHSKVLLCEAWWSITWCCGRGCKQLTSFARYLKSVVLIRNSL
jgi:hypothetical protein